MHLVELLRTRLHGTLDHVGGITSELPTMSRYTQASSGALAALLERARDPNGQRPDLRIRALLRVGLHDL